MRTESIVHAAANVIELHDRQDAEPGFSWAMVGKIWWSFVWRALVYTLLVMLSLCLLAGAAGQGRDALIALLLLVGALAWIPVGIWAMRDALNASWRGFRIRPVHTGRWCTLRATPREAMLDAERTARLG